MNALLSSPVLSWLLSYLFNALWQIPLIFAAAWIAARLLRRADPQIGHRVWVGALLLQVALPACELRIGALMSWLASWLTWGQGSAVRDGHIRILIGPSTAAVGALRLPFVLEAGIVLAFACCMLYFAGQLAWGLLQTHALAHNATRLILTGETAQRWSEYCRRFGITAPSPEIAAAPQGIGPVTVGLRRGLVLLPPAFLESIARHDLDAVLAHELAHIQRHDFAKNLLYGLLSLPVMWHPFLWRTRARVAESRELVCDAVAAEAVAGRKQYAQSLLRLAAILACRPAIPTLHALGILSFNEDRNALERRVMTLTHKPAQMSATRRIVVSTVCSVLALATCTSALALRTDVSSWSPAQGNSAAGTTALTRIHVKPSIMVGQRISGHNPTYPKEERAKKIQGTVVLDVIIGKDGATKDLHIVKSPDKQFSESALKAVRTWRYRPYLLNGNPIEVNTTVNVIYCLSNCHWPADS
jgi:TonB family protein